MKMFDKDVGEVSTVLQIGLLRKKRQRSNVQRLYDGEVPAVEGGDFGKAKPFGQRDHCRIGGAEREARVLEHELRSPPVVAACQLDGRQSSICQ